PPASQREKIAEVVARLVEQVRAEHPAETVGIGAAGLVDKQRTTVVLAPNINWVGEPLATRVRALVDLPVVIENDANAAAWGEFRYGAGYDSDDLLLLTLGTGIGGGVVQDGRLNRGGFGLAGEVGHLRVVRDGLRCGCGQYGCWEQYGSGRALVREAQDRIRDDLEGTGPLAEAV